MNQYYIRCLPVDWDTMLALLETLGAIKLTYEGYETLEGSETKVPIGKPTISATSGGDWDYIGEIPEPTGVMIQTDEGEYPETAPIADAKGTPYLYANLVTPLSLGALAQQMAEENPLIAEGMSNLPKYTLLDDQGDARLPSKPYRVFA